MIIWNMFRASTYWICGDKDFQLRMAECGLSDIADLSSPSLGEHVASHATSWVRRWEDGPTAYYIKTYDYPTCTARFRGLGRNTFLAQSRPYREQKALRWLADHGFPVPQVRAVIESRFLRALAGGFLLRGVLVTEAWQGEPLPVVLSSLSPEQCTEVLKPLHEFVTRLHTAGFRDRNMNLRNILARKNGSGWQFVKIDSPRFRLVTPGPAKDVWTQEDWQRLNQDLASMGLSFSTAFDKTS